MNFKIKFFDKAVRKKFYFYFTIFAVIFQFILPVFNQSFYYRIVLYCLLGFTILLYLSIWIYELTRGKIKLKINSSQLIIKTDNLFSQNCLKTIGFNEYFDDIADDKIIAKGSLHGQYLLEYCKNPNTLYEKINSDERMSKSKLDINHERKCGRNQRYKLGCIFENEGFLLTAFAKFDSENRANLSIQDYIDFLFNYWNELDVIYNGRSIAIPLFGSGITRFDNYSITKQELLELLIWSFKFTNKNSKSIIIVLDQKTIKNINLSKLKEFE